jgi:hypothetical protein
MLGEMNFFTAKWGHRKIGDTEVFTISKRRGHGWAPYEVIDMM